MSLKIDFLNKLSFNLQKSPIQQKITALESKIGNNSIFSPASNPITEAKPPTFKEIDMSTWKRKQHFDLFMSNEKPFYQLTAKSDITKFLEVAKKKNIPVSQAMLYMLSKSTNEVPEFKQRISNGKLIEYDRIGITSTIAKKDGTFNIQALDYFDNPIEFLKQSYQKINNAKIRDEIFDEKAAWQTGDNVVYSTCLPWLDFTSFTNPVGNGKTDFVPRLAWGKFTHLNRKDYVPVSVEVNHALVDGGHIANFFTRLQENLNNSKEIFKTINKYDNLK